MASPLADPGAALALLRARGWIPRRAEDFRHLPPPPAAVWLGEGAEHGATPAQDWAVHAPPGVAWQHLAADALPWPEPPADDAAPFAWAHRALCRGALSLRVAATARSPIVVAHRAQAAVAAPLLRIEVDDGVQAVLLETHGAGAPGGACNLQVHLRLGAGSRLVHLRTVTPGPGERIAHHLQVQVGQGARYHQRMLAGGADYHLQRCVVDLDVPDAQADLAAVVLAGAGQRIEQQVRLAHDAPRTEGTITALALARDDALAVLNARSLVAPGCDDAVLAQRLSAIPTAGQPRAVLRPHLDIRHDRIEARHGATWGALPEEAIFLARQRGLDEAAATALVLQGMAQALLARGLPDPAVLEAADLPAILETEVRRHLADATEAAHG